MPALSRLSTGTSGSCSSSARASSENNDIIGVERFKTLGGGGGGRRGSQGRGWAQTFSWLKPTEFELCEAISAIWAHLK